MRTKTPEQIYAQSTRILQGYGINDLQRMQTAYEATLRYVANIYRANGIPDQSKCTDTERANWIFHHAAEPRSVYAAK